jgi:hypothetical protein
MTKQGKIMIYGRRLTTGILSSSQQSAASAVHAARHRPSAAGIRKPYMSAELSRPFPHGAYQLGKT